jgi:farnesyl diphosphate synthase
MESISLQEFVLRNKRLIDAALGERLPASDLEPRLVHEAMRYAVMSNGKRVRPLFSLAVAELAGAPTDQVIDAACAIEFAHTASLILDDLPCMDDAQMRRGRLCTHLKYDKATALLAAMGLLAEAFALIAQNARKLQVDAAAPVLLLAEAIGTRGLIYGQHIDLQLTGKQASIEQLEIVHDHKAGALFQAAMQIPANLLGMPAAETAVLQCYAKQIGLVFQIIDDMLDATGSAEDVDKVTFAGTIGMGPARERVEQLIQEVALTLEPLGERAALLRQLADHVHARIAQ